MTQPPNIREVDCCANCEYVEFLHGYTEVYCKKYNRWIMQYTICDDFKREE